MARILSDHACNKALQRLAEGDVTALSVIYDNTARLIFSLALSLLGNREDAEDVLQDTMLKLVKAAPNYKKGSPKAWVLSIARNCALDTLRKHRVNSDEAEPYSPDPELERLEVTDMLNALNDDEKQTVVLHIYGGFSHKEIGAVLGISPAAAQKKYRRALLKLKRYCEVLTMNKRTIRKHFKRFNELDLPEKEKILPPEALTQVSAKGRKPLPRLAAAALSIAVLASLLIIGFTGYDPDKPSPEDSRVVAVTESSEVFYDEPSEVEKSEEPKIEIPIISCGNYTNGTEDCYIEILPGEVYMRTMSNTPINIDELQDDVLYAVKFYPDISGSAEYKEGIKHLGEECATKRRELKEKALAFIKEHAKAENHHYLEYYKVYDYDYICQLIYDQLPSEYWPGKDAQGFDEITLKRDTDIFWEYDYKKVEFTKQINEAAKAKMYGYLEGLGIRFYDKTVYVHFSLIEDYTEKELISESVYRIAFLTKEEIKALKGGEDYGIFVELVFDELAKMDNEPVHLEPWGIDD